VPAVSVIMPAYNVARYVGAAIESVCAQTFRDLELLVVDDGSTDETPAMVRGYALRDSRVRVVRQPNGGISSARNRGLRESTADVIAILDSDDLWEPGFLEAQLRILAERPDVDIVTGNAWDLGGRHDGRPARPWPDARPEPDLHTIITDEQAVFIMSVFRRRVYETIGGFDESLRTNEDYDLWLRAAAAGLRFARNDRPLGHYRRRDDSLSASEVRMLEGILQVYRKNRPLVAGRPHELAALDAQAARFERERFVALTRLGLQTSDGALARYGLSGLRAIDGGARLGLACAVARWAPVLLARAYRFRGSRTEARA
jgi:glycosyltransferase involved in cell wall biosynthesis